MNPITVTTVPAALIVAGTNDRQTFNERELQQLATNIETHGLAQPPTVRPIDGPNGVSTFQIVAGERRVRAMRDYLKWSDIPCIVRVMSDSEASAVMLAENLHRVDLDPMEEARAYGQRLALFGGSVADVAEFASVPVNRVRERLSLLNLCDSVQPLVARKELPIRYALKMTDLDVNRQHLALQAYIQTDSMGYAAFCSLCNRLYDEQNQETMFDTGDFLRVAEYVLEAQQSVTLPTVAVDPVGQKDIANRLGVKRMTVAQWIQRDWVDFPAPKWHVSDSPVWNWADVELWANERKAKKSKLPIDTVSGQ